MKYLIILVFSQYLISFSSCPQNSSALSELSTDPCYTDREITDPVVEAEVTCLVSGENILMEIKEENKRYLICNPEDKAYLTGDTYIISGVCYEMKPNERWPGTPRQLSSIKKKE